MQHDPQTKARPLHTMSSTTPRSTSSNLRQKLQIYLRSGSNLSSPSIVFSYLQTSQHIASSHKIKPGNIHSKYNPATKDQPCQTWHCARPKGQETLVFQDFGRADEAVFVFFSCFDGLHAGLSSVNHPSVSTSLG